MQSIDMVKLLIAKGANVNFVDKTHSTPLHIAAELNNPEIIHYLVLNGANVNSTDSFLMILVC